MTDSRARKEISQRNLLLVIAGVAGLGVLLGGAGFWFVLNWIADSAPSKTAQAFLREHPEVRADLGDSVWSDGIIRGKISDGAVNGYARLRIPLRGSRGSEGVAEVRLAKSGVKWRVTAASYEGEDGQRRQLALRDGEVPAEEPRAAAAAEDAAQRKLVHAHALYRSGRSSEALAELNALLEQTPDHAEALYWRAQIRVKLGWSEPALVDIRRAVALNIDKREAYQLLDSLLMREQRWEEIIAAWTQYLERHPDDDVALLERAGARHHQGDETQAREDLERSCELGNSKACQIFNR
jgi:tetratricopeptide (TPR) repeat protein